MYEFNEVKPMSEKKKIFNNKNDYIIQLHGNTVYQFAEIFI